MMGPRYSKNVKLCATLRTAILVLIPSIGAAQVGANLGGVVRDESGGALPGVSITIVNTATGAKQSSVTDEAGGYRAVNLTPGQYEITAELAGFATLKRQIVLNIGANQTVDLTMGLGEIQESITVTSVGPRIEVATAQLSSIIESKQLENIPVLTRNILELAQILPGSAPDNSRLGSFLTTKFGGVADQRTGFTFMVDGGTLDDAIWGATLVNVSQEAVQEFTVLRNSFDARYGHALVSVVSVATKSGTNLLTGSGYYFGRDEALAKRNFFDRGPTQQPFSQKRLGGTIGGPIKRDVAHYFAAAEYNDIDTVKILALPPSNPFAAEHNGSWPSGTNNKMGLGKLDLRFGGSHSTSVRYLGDSQYALRLLTTSESNQGDEVNKTHSVVARDNWIMSSRLVNTLDVHVVYQLLELIGHSDDVTIVRPSITTGSRTNSYSGMPRWQTTISDAMYIKAGRHDLRFGGHVGFFRGRLDSFWNDGGTFQFTTNAPFDPNNPATYPLFFLIKEPATWHVQSKQLGAFFQDDWQLSERFRLNLGLRYDLDTNFRDNEFYIALLDRPEFAGIERWVDRSRSMDNGNLQPRAGFTWDVRGDGNLVVRGAAGLYATRNRPWMQMTARDQTDVAQVRINDPARLRFFPDVNAVLGGRTIAENLAEGSAARPLVMMDNEMELTKSFNKTIGVGWQINLLTSLEIDFVHDYTYDGWGMTDRNLPPSGPISASNPRPVARFQNVNIQENYTRNWYSALETQFRTRIRGTDTVSVSYSLSRNYRDGVYFHSNMRGTQRTPNERGHNENDGRHNLSIAGSSQLPWGIQVAGVFKAISGSPRFVQSGVDLDGDGSLTGDRPADLPAQIGREKVDESLRIINDFRAGRGLAPISADLLKLDKFISLDARVSKMLQLRGTHRLELFFEGFNLTNHVNYEPFTVVNNMIAADFQQRRSARAPRQAQWGARYTF